MRSPYSEARESIDLKLTLGVLLGGLHESHAEVWKDAFRHLDDKEMGMLIRKTSSLDSRRATSYTVRFLMERHYPFREMIQYHTNDGFKIRMGLYDILDDLVI